MGKSAAQKAKVDSPKTDGSGSPKRKKRSWWRIAGITFGIIIVVIACVRPMLPWAVRWYVNKTLSRSLIYQGRIGDVTLNLWRGAYSISDIRMIKKTGNVPTPFFRAKRLELAIQWNGILAHKLVGQVVMDSPELNFVDSSDNSDGQLGNGGPWLSMLTDLFPFKLNSVQIHDGSIHFRSYKRATPVDVYLSNLEGSIDDLTNLRDRSTPMLTTVQASGLAMDQAQFEIRMKLNPFSREPTFHMATRLIGLDITKINELAMTYGQFQFKRGWFDLVIEADCNHGQLEGYVKPLFRNLIVFDPLQDLAEDENPIQYFWQALLGAVTGVLKNQPRDQFGTSIPFAGDMASPDPDILQTIGNVLRNGFVRAYLPRLQNGTESFDDMHFSAGKITDPTSIGDDQ